MNKIVAEVKGPHNGDGYGPARTSWWAAKLEWQRGRDSNLGERFTPSNGLANRLGHFSGSSSSPVEMHQPSARQARFGTLIPFSALRTSLPATHVLGSFP